MRDIYIYMTHSLNYDTSFIERIKAEDAVRQEKEAARAARRAMKEVQREAMMQNAAVLWNQLKQVGS